MSRMGVTQKMVASGSPGDWFFLVPVYLFTFCSINEAFSGG